MCIRDRPYVTIHDNKPDFTEAELAEDVFESYSELDAKGRCGVAEAMIGDVYKRQVHNTLLGVVGYAACIVYYGMIRMGRADMVTLLTIAFLFAIMAVYVFSYPKYRSEQIMITFFGLVYVAVMLSYVYQTRELTQGAYLSLIHI